MVKKLFEPSKVETVLEGIINSSLLNFFSRGFGYLKNVVIAVLLGFSFETDAVFMALSLIGIFVIFTDVFDSVGIPNLVRARQSSEAEFQRLSGFLFTFTVVLAVLVGALAVLLYPLISRIAVGFKGEVRHFLKESYFLLVPYLFLSFVFHHLGAILRSVRKFTTYFVGEFIFSLSCFVLTTLGLYFLRDWRVIPASISLSQIMATLYMLLVGRRFLHFKFYMDPVVKDILTQFFYLCALYGVLRLFVVVDKGFASLLGEKGVSALTYGFMVASIPRGILKLEHMAITSLSEAKEPFMKLKFYAKKIFQLSIPLAILLMFCAGLLVRLLFGYGAFSVKDMDLTAQAARFYALSLPFMFLWPIMYRTFQVINWLKPLFVIALASIALNTLLNYMFVLVLKMGVPGVCIGTFGAYMFLCSLSYWFLRYRFSGGI